MDLADFLLARIAADEAAARRASPGPWALDSNECCVGRPGAQGPDYFVTERSTSNEDAAHIARHDPARVLAECEAKRAIVEVRQTIDAHVRQIALNDHEEARDARNTRAGLDVALKALALPYADHESYREEWKP